MTQFLSQENAQFISGMFQKFMQDKYQFRYETVMKSEEYLKLLGTTMTRIYREHRLEYEIGDMNKITISDLKKHFLENYLSKPAPAAAPPVAGPSVSLEPIPEEPSGFSEDSEFFNRLQKLEFQRKTFTPGNATHPLVFPPAEQTTPAQNASPQVPAAITTVYMPTPIKIGKELKICSWQRDWIQEPARNYFTWKGPLPKQMDRTNTRVGCLIGPSHILHETNMISLVVEGANEDEVSVTLIPSHTVGEYTIFRPILESLSYLRLLALPWKVSLESGDGERVALGEDRIPYLVVGEKRLQVSSARNVCRPGESLRLFLDTSKKIIPVRVKEVGEDEIEVYEKVSGNGWLLNYSRQISLVFETTTSEHKN